MKHLNTPLHLHLGCHGQTKLSLVAFLSHLCQSLASAMQDTDAAITWKSELGNRSADDDSLCKHALALPPCTPDEAGCGELKTFACERHDLTRSALFVEDDHDIDSNAHDVYQELLRLKVSLEVAPIPEDPTAITLRLKHMILANRSALDDVFDLMRLKSEIALCKSSATDSNRLNRSACRMMKEQALEAHHLDIRMRQHLPHRLRPKSKVTSPW